MVTSRALLKADEAALRLGITQGLLYAYVRNSPKGDGRKLKAIPHEGEFLFTAENLEEWEAYLKKPWPPSGERRPEVPRYVKTYLKVESGDACALCGRGRGLDYAHIDSYASTENNFHHNLICLCKGCHFDYDSGLIPKSKIKALKASLVQKIRERQNAGRQFSRGVVHRVPQPDALFVGREEEISALRDQLRAERFVILEGVGGIGKTQLLVNALQQLDDLPTVWFDVESYQTLQDLQLAILSALMKEGVTVDSATSLFDVLDTQQLRIVFDGLDRVPADESDTVTDFLNDMIRHTREPRLVVTTQIEMGGLGGGAHRFIVPPLSPSASGRLIASDCGQAGGPSLDEGDAEWLMTFCDGHALSLRLVVGLLRYYKKSSVVVERLNAAGAGEMKEHGRKEQKRSSSLRVCLGAAYSCFDHGQKRLLGYLSSYPAGCVELLARGWQVAGDYNGDVAELRRFFFVEVRPDGLLKADRLHLLNPVREFVKGEWEKGAGEEGASIQLDACQHLMSLALLLNHEFLEKGVRPAQAQYGLLRLESELPNFLEALKYAEEVARERKAGRADAEQYYEMIAGFTRGLSKYCFVRGFLAQGMPIIVSGLKALKELKLHREMATQLMMLANMQARMHDREGHTQTVGALVELTGELDDDRIFALASLGIGDMLKHEGKFSEAAAAYERATEHFREELSEEASDPAGDEERYLTGMLALALTSLAEVHHRLKQPQEAIRYGLEAVNYIQKVGDQTNLGVIWHELGNSYAESGEMTKAVEAYQRALISFLELGYREYVGNAICEMGEAVVEGGFIPELDSVLTENVLRVVLADVKEYVGRIAMRSGEIFADDGSPMRKLFGTIKLVSFTDQVWMLKEWSDEIGEEVYDSLVAALEDNYDQRRAAFTECLFRVISIAKWLGKISSEGVNYTDEQLFVLCGLCHDLASVWVVSKPFDWLAAFLNHRGGRKKITGMALYETFAFACRHGNPSLFRLE